MSAIRAFLAPFFPYLAIAGAVAILGLGWWLNHRGYERGYAAKNAEVIAAAHRLAEKAERVRGVIDAQAVAIQQARQQQDTETRIIHDETTRIIERPVYRSICVDADGVRLLDRAVASANREPSGLFDGAAPNPAADAPRR